MAISNRVISAVALIGALTGVLRDVHASDLWERTECVANHGRVRTTLRLFHDVSRTQIKTAAIVKNSSSAPGAAPSPMDVEHMLDSDDFETVWLRTGHLSIQSAKNRTFIILYGPDGIATVTYNPNDDQSIPMTCRVSARGQVGMAEVMRTHLTQMREIADAVIPRTR